MCKFAECNIKTQEVFHWEKWDTLKKLSGYTYVPFHRYMFFISDTHLLNMLTNNDEKAPIHMNLMLVKHSAT